MTEWNFPSPFRLTKNLNYKKYYIDITSWLCLPCYYTWTIFHTQSISYHSRKFHIFVFHNFIFLICLFLLCRSFSDPLFFSRNLPAFLHAGHVQFPETWSGFWLINLHSNPYFAFLNFGIYCFTYWLIRDYLPRRRFQTRGRALFKKGPRKIAAFRMIYLAGFWTYRIFIESSDWISFTFRSLVSIKTIQSGFGILFW